MDDETCYEMIDRLLRNNLGDDDYAEYLEALDHLSRPTPRTWVGLTDEEIDELDEQSPSLYDFVQNLMSKLKEKNT